MMKNIIITGGAGFIGSNLVQKLHSKGYNITILDNLSPQVHGNNYKESYTYNLIKDKTIFIKGDVRNKADWLKALKENEIVIHFAAETGTGQSMYKICNYIDVNLKGTAILLDILVNNKHSVKKIILASSRAVYGEGKYRCPEHGIVYPSPRDARDLVIGDFNCKCPVCNLSVNVVPTDEESKINPISIYGLTKYNQEQMIMIVCKTLNIPAVVLRYQNVYGPGQSLLNPYTGILSIFSTQILTGRDISVFEDGNESRDIVYIDDVIDATLMSIESNAGDFQIFNVGTGTPVTILEIVQLLKRNLNLNVKINVTGNYRMGDIRHNYADLERTKKIFNYSPKYNLQNGLKLFTKWVISQDKINSRYEESIIELRKKGLLK